MRHVNIVHQTQGLQPSHDLRLINLDASSFKKKGNCPTAVPMSDSAQTSSNPDGEVFFPQTLSPRQDAGTLELLPSLIDDRSTTSGVNTQAVNHSLLDFDNLSSFDFEIDQFMVLSPFPFSATELPFPAGRAETTTVSSPNVTAAHHSPYSSDYLTGVPDISTSQSTDRRLYWTFTDDQWESFITRAKCLCPDSESRLPSRQSISRYMAAYFRSFHEHLPFLHASTIR